MFRRFRRSTRLKPNAYDLASRAFSSLRRTGPQPAPAPVLPQSFTRLVLRVVGLFALGFLAPPVVTFLVLVLLG